MIPSKVSGDGVVDNKSKTSAAPTALALASVWVKNSVWAITWKVTKAAATQKNT
ncbi:hypothetical protein ALO_18467, partial [Acetonema longum DSM 6540]